MTDKQPTPAPDDASVAGAGPAEAASSPAPADGAGAAPPASASSPDTPATGGAESVPAVDVGEAAPESSAAGAVPDPPVETPSAPDVPADAGSGSADRPGVTGLAAAPADAPPVPDALAAADTPSAPGTADAPDAAAGLPEDATVPAGEEALAAGGSLSSDRIQLVSESGGAVTIGVRTVLGKHMVRQFGDDFNVWDTEQCTVERGADGAWQIVPQAGTTNETLLNGETLTAPRPLREGDVIAVGRAAKGIARLPLTVRPA